MSEIKKAIDYWKEFKQEAIDMIKNQEDIEGELKRQIPMCDLAIQALTEKLEREQGCEYCNGERHEISKYDIADSMEIYYNNPVKAHYMHLMDTENSTGILNCKINFCPICGRSLQNE